MREFKQRRKFKKKLYSKFVIFLLVLVIILLAKGTWGIFQKSRESDKRLEISQERLIELKKRQSAVVSRIEILKTSTGVEEEIRTKYDVAKEGEHVIIIVQDDDSVEEAEEPKGLKGLWHKITSILD